MIYPDDFIDKIICGDCLEVMSKLPDKCIDLILCDLPYGVTNRNEWDQIIPFEPLWEQYLRITKESAPIILTATQPFASELINSNKKMFKYDLIWAKNKSTGFLNSKKMPLRKHESILVFYKKKPTYNPQKSTGHKPVNSFTQHGTGSTNYGKTKNVSGGGQTDRFPSSILFFPVVNNDSVDKVHPTQKPIPLFKYLIETYSNENDVVLDNCIGSGTTAFACIESKRKFIGIEKNKEYCDLMDQKLKELNRKSTFFFE